MVEAGEAVVTVVAADIVIVVELVGARQRSRLI